MQNTFRTSEGSMISFEWKEKKHVYLSEKKGEPVFMKVLTGTIMPPGQSKSTLVHEFLTEFDGKKTKSHLYDRYRREIEAFLNGETKNNNETAIEQWDQVDEQFCKKLKALNINTVEDIAALSDVALQAVGMGARDLQKKAKLFVSAGKDTKLAAELVRRVIAEEEDGKKHRAKLELAVEKKKEEAKQNRGDAE